MKVRFAKNTLCVLTDQDKTHKAYSLEVYTPTHRQQGFNGGLYRELETEIFRHVTEADAYGILSDFLKSDCVIRFSYDAQQKVLKVFPFEPQEETKE